jgi:DNA-binding NarL/FixJ family response regulator
MLGINSPRVLIADDHVLIAEGFRKLLANDFNVVAIVHDGLSLVETAEKLRPDVILVDVGMPFLNGFEAGNRLRRLVPEARLIYVTVNVEPELVKECFRQGASGYVSKEAAGSELIAAVHEAISGRFYLSAQLRSVIGDLPSPFPHTRPPSRLTDRQFEVLQLLAEGKSMKEAAAVLQLTARTVAFHKYRIREKLHLGSDAEVVQYALRHHVLFG